MVIRMKKLGLSKKDIIFYILTFVVILGGDQLSKFIVDQTINFGTGYPIIKNFFYFTYVHNYGAAWGMLEGQRYFFYLVSAIAAVGLIYYFIKSLPYQKLTRFGLVLVFSGMLGNFIDRFIFGFVRDFIDFIIFGYNFPVFNIADIAIVVGVGLLILEVGLEEYQTWKLSKSQ